MWIIILGAAVSLIGSFFNSPSPHFDNVRKEKYRRIFLCTALVGAGITIFGAYKAATDKKHEEEIAKDNLIAANKRADAAEARARETQDLVKGLGISLGTDQLDAAEFSCGQPLSQFPGGGAGQVYKVLRYPSVELWFKIPGGAYAFASSPDGRRKITNYQAETLLPCVRKLVAITPRIRLPRPTEETPSGSQAGSTSTSDATSGIYVFGAIVLIVVFFAARKRTA